MDSEPVIWDGTVYDVDADEFTAVLRDRSGHPEEIATFRFEVVPEADRHLIKPGAFFEWAVDPNDESSRITFSRKVWTQEEIDRAYARAAEFAAFFKTT